MDIYPKILENQINELNGNLKSLNSSIAEFSKSSDGLQTKMIFWTKVMTLAVIVQALAIGVQIYLAYLFK